MTRHVELGPGDLFAVSDQVILVRHTESVIAKTSAIGTEGEQIAYFVTFEGKLNNRPEQGSVTVAISPTDAFQLAEELMRGLDLLVTKRDEQDPT